MGERGKRHRCALMATAGRVWPVHRDPSDRADRPCIEIGHYVGPPVRPWAPRRARPDTNRVATRRFDVQPNKKRVDAVNPCT